VRQARHREERAGEEEHRHDDEAEEPVESFLALQPRRERRHRSGVRETDENRRRPREDRPRRVQRAEPGEDHRETHGADVNYKRPFHDHGDVKPRKCTAENDEGGQRKSVASHDRFGQKERTNNWNAGIGEGIIPVA